MAIAARVASHRISGAQVAFVRFAAGVLAVLVALALGRASLRPSRWGWLVARGVFGGLAVLSYYTAIARIGAGLATLLNYTAPMWSLLLGWILLGERPRRDAVVALLLTTVGVVLVVGVRDFSASGWALIGVLSAVFSGIAVTSIRAARRPSAQGLPGESAWSVFASFTALGCVATAPATFGPWGSWTPPTAFEWAILALVAISSIVAQLIMTSALQHVTAVGSGIVHQLTPIIALLGGVLLLGETLSPLATVGTLLTLGGVIWTIFAAGRD